ncbi:hypothetical protein L5F46_10920 [Aliarcobacter butzleri]|uniref:hypothetical protein n=1 Tax=Aliarcobacter butzleri TaxID=28197 RepID=UPI000DB63AB0|nr:hypothetical protein [Aliarcobacter butzleri]MCG3675283.1 hypothetical protein [Aliarcobacter butzleri]MDN5046993.1 hypothetical protein [Aliarcobacter butzleri]NUW26966.1 hypothetical protein [Aliarcobacter butzleri]PZQ08903.1 MAG: hypothetical protein DI567_01595 [Aliarcobacter butzleri]
MENKYKNFDESMQSLREIENKLKSLGDSENVKLEIVMNLREEALKHHKICNDVLKEIKETLKQNNEQ